MATILLRFARKGNWEPEVLARWVFTVDARHLADSADVFPEDGDCVFAIVENNGDVYFRTHGFVPLDIEEGIWRAVGRPEKAGETGEVTSRMVAEALAGTRPPSPASIPRDVYVQHNSLAHELEGQAGEERRHSESLTLAARLLRDYLCQHPAEPAKGGA